MRARKLNTEARQEQIAGAVLSLIGTHGVQNLSIAMVAEHVGIVPSGIYRHFKGKDELLNAALELIGKKLAANVDKICRQSSDALDRLRLLLMHETTMLIENQAIPHIVFSESIFTESEHRKTRIKSIMDGYFHKIREIICKGQQDGRIRPDIDSLTISLMFKGMILPAVVLWKTSDKDFDLVRHAESAWELFQSAVSIQT